MVNPFTSVLMMGSQVMLPVESAIAMPILAVMAYVLGGIPVGFLVGRFHGTDIRDHGSGNIGTTNVLRLFGAKWAAFVLLADAFKGVLACLAADQLIGIPWFTALCGVAAIAGHNWSIFLRFRGGKGAATTAGVFIYITPAVLGIGLGTAILLFAVTRYVSLGVMVGTLAGAIVAWFFDYPLTYQLATVVALVWILVRHRSNIVRLMRGEERRLGEKEAYKEEGQIEHE